ITAEPEQMYPETAVFKSTRPSGSGDPARNSTGHSNSDSALESCAWLHQWWFRPKRAWPRKLALRAESLIVFYSANHPVFHFQVMYTLPVFSISDCIQLFTPAAPPHGYYFGKSLIYKGKI